MKEYFLITVFVAFSININAQITLEHTYDSASTIGNAGFYDDQLMIINFEASGERYVKINRTGQSINIYDMNHFYMKRISLSCVPYYDDIAAIIYLSEHLFNNDNKIEFMYATLIGSVYYTGIYNEDGTLIFSDTGAAVITVNIKQQQFPIYNTSVGTKMILSYRGGIAKVFNLPGTLSDDIAEANNNLIAIQYNSSVSNPYPNPNDGSTQIDYTLPEGVNEGEIVFYDLMGNEVKRFKVDRTFNTLLVSTSDIATGTYFYQLQTTAENSEGKKMVVIK